MAKIVRRIQPDCFLVTGNGLATEIKGGLFTWIPELDAIARSEGDGIILDICKDGKLVKDSDGNKIIKDYTPKQFCGSVIVDDNGDGTYTCTKLHVYKEEFLVDSDINISKVTSK